MAANDYRIARRNSTNTADITYFCPTPTGSQSAFFVVDGPNNQGIVATLGYGLNLNSGSIGVAGLNKSDVGLSNVENTSDANKPVSTVVQTALDGKENFLGSGTTAQYLRGDKTWAAFPAIPSAQVNSDWNSSSGVSQILNKPSLSTVATSGAYNDLSGKPTLGTAASQNSSAFEPAISSGTSSDYWRGDKTWQALNKSVVGLGNVDNTSDVNKPISTATQTALNGKFNSPSGTIAQYIRGDGSLASFPSVGSGTVTSVGITSSDFTISGSPVTSSGNITANLNVTGVTPGTYNNLTVNNKGVITSAQSISQSSVSRTLNSAFQISSTRWTSVSYAVDVSATLSISGGQTGTLILEVASDSGFTTNVQTLNSSVNGNTGTLTVGLSLTQTATATVCGWVPPGYYTRLRTVNTTGTPTFTYRTGQETLL